MAVYKNVASQKLAVFAVDSTGAAKTGDAANITAYVSKDGGAAIASNDTNPTELDATNAKGIYLFDMTQSETNADLVVLVPKSSTSGVTLRPVIVYTVADIYGRIGAPVGASISADIAGVQSDTNDIQTRIPAALVSGRIDASVGAMATDTITSTALAASAVTEIQSGLSTLDAAGVRTAVGLTSANLDTQLTAIDDYLDTEVAAIKAKTDNLPSDPADASDVAAAFSTVNSTLSTIASYIDTEVAAILADTNELQTDWANGGRLDLLLDAIIAYLDTEVAAILEDTGTTIPAQISALNNLSAAQVNAEVVDALATDTYAEPGQGAPAATASLKDKIGYIYKFLRNKKTQTATTKSIYNDDAATVDHKCTVSDDGTTYTETEITTGP